MATGRQFFEDAKKLMTEGNVKGSIEAFTKAIDAGEKDGMVFLSRGVAYLRNHETDRAINDFAEAVKKDEKNVRAHFYRGVAYMLKEDYKDAVGEFDKTIQLDPNHGAAFFARGTAYAQMGNDTEGTKNMKTAITFSESNLYQLQETIGLWRTQFDKAMSLMSGRKQPPELTLTDEEHQKIRQWLQEGYD